MKSAKPLKSFVANSKGWCLRCIVVHLSSRSWQHANIQTASWNNLSQKLTEFKQAKATALLEILWRVSCICSSTVSILSDTKRECISAHCASARPKVHRSWVQANLQQLLRPSRITSGVSFINASADQHRLFTQPSVLDETGNAPLHQSTCPRQSAQRHCKAPVTLNKFCKVMVCHVWPCLHFCRLWNLFSVNRLLSFHLLDISFVRLAATEFQGLAVVEELKPGICPPRPDCVTDSHAMTRSQREPFPPWRKW